MKGFVSVEIPTKNYIKAYLFSIYGNRPLITREDKIGNKFYDLLQHTTNREKLEFSTRYSTTVTLFISKHTFRQRGACINESNIKAFNRFLEKEIKDSFLFLMDTYMEILPSVEANLLTVRNRLGIDVEAWPDDSVRKFYYRYRKSNGKKLIYTKTYSGSVPSEKPENMPY